MLAQLEKTYGGTDVNMPFEERIMEIADRIAQDYYEELLPELNYVKEGSFLDDLDELNLGIRLNGFMMITQACIIMKTLECIMIQIQVNIMMEMVHIIIGMRNLKAL